MNTTDDMDRDVPSKRTRLDRLTRRRFLAFSSLAALVLLALGSAFAVLYRMRDHPQLRRLIGLEIDAASGTGELTESELETLVAYGDVLYPTGYDSNGVHGQEIRSVTTRTASKLAAETAGYRKEFSDAVRFLNEESRKRFDQSFAGLPLEERRQMVNELLATIVAASFPVRVMMCVSSSGQLRWRLYSHVGVELMDGFYRSPPGWRVFGYPYRPGTCSNLIDFQYSPQI